MLFVFKVFSSSARATGAIIPTLFVRGAGGDIRTVRLDRLFFLFARVPPGGVFSFSRLSTFFVRSFYVTTTVGRYGDFFRGAPRSPLTVVLVTSSYFVFLL